MRINGPKIKYKNKLNIKKALQYYSHVRRLIISLKDCIISVCENRMMDCCNWHYIDAICFMTSPHCNTPIRTWKLGNKTRPGTEGIGIDFSGMERY